MNRKEDIESVTKELKNVLLRAIKNQRKRISNFV